MAFPVRAFFSIDKYYTLLMDIEDNDTTKVVDENNKEIGLKFDHSANVIFKEEKIARICMSFDDKPTLRLILNPHEKDEKEIDTEVNQNRSEAYLDAEVIVTKYLIENKIITLEE